jgi:hypothetical protein
MPTVVTVKPGERVEESGIYQATKPGQRISLREGQRTPLSPLPRKLGANRRFP